MLFRNRRGGNASRPKESSRNECFADEERKPRETYRKDGVFAQSEGAEREREVVQPGGMPALGAGGRRFESCLPDKKIRQSPSNTG